MKKKMKIRREISVCEWQKVKPIMPKPNSIIGLAIENLDKGIIHGLRHNPESNSNGWFIWTGEYSEKEDFFKPICFEHLSTYLKIDLIQYLELPPGFRFLIDGNNYEDVWFDKKLLK